MALLSCSVTFQFCVRLYPRNSLPLPVFTKDLVLVKLLMVDRTMYQDVVKV